MKHWETTSGHKIYQVLSGRSNAYLIYINDYTILVDTGKTNTLKKLINNKKKITNERKINTLVLTHTHFDHCQNAKSIQQQEKCSIIASEKAVKYTCNGYSPLPKGTNAITNTLSLIGKRIGKERFGYEFFTIDIAVRDSFSFPANHPVIKVIDTPGHSEDSISVIVDNEIAIVGDTLFGVFKPFVFPPYVDNKHELLVSWEKLLKTKCYLFLPGHGSEIRREDLHLAYYRVNN